MSKSHFCVPIQAETFKELQKKIQCAQPQADIIEIWLDCLNFELQPKQLFQLTSKPLLLVCKTTKEGGKWHGSEEGRFQLLQKYLSFKPAYIDLSVDANPRLLKEFNSLKKEKTKLILSYHHFSRTPSLKVLERIVEKAFNHGADIVKIATFAQKTEDNFIMLRLLQQTKRPLIAHCMGEKGILSRLLASRFGSGIVYVALDRNSKTAPGQMTKEEYLKLQRKYITK